MEVLGVDLLNPALVKDGVALTNCSFAVLLQQLYTLGPSGFVEFAGDGIFLASSRSAGDENAKHDDGSCDNDDNIGLLRYPPDIARAMSLYKPMKIQKSTGPVSSRGNRSTPVVVLDDEMEPQTLYPDDEAAGNLSQRLKPKGGPGQAFSASMRQRLPRRFADRLLRIHVERWWGKIILVDFQNTPDQLARTADESLLEFVVQDALAFLKPHEMKEFLGYERQLRIS